MNDLEKEMSSVDNSKIVIPPTLDNMKEPAGIEVLPSIYYHAAIFPRKSDATKFSNWINKQDDVYKIDRMFKVEVSDKTTGLFLRKEFGVKFLGPLYESRDQIKNNSSRYELKASELDGRHMCMESTTTITG